MARSHFDRGDAIRGGVGDINERGVARHGAVGGRRAKDHRFRNLGSPGVDNFKAMRTGDADVEFSSIWFQQQGGGCSAQP